MYLLKICLNKRTILSKRLTCFEIGKCNSNGVTSLEYNYEEERYFLSKNKEKLIILQDKYKKRHDYEDSYILNLDNIKINDSYIEI